MFTARPYSWRVTAPRMVCKGEDRNSDTIGIWMDMDGDSDTTRTSMVTNEGIVCGLLTQSEMVIVLVLNYECITARCRCRWHGTCGVMVRSKSVGAKDIASSKLNTCNPWNIVRVGEGGDIRQD